MKRVIDDPAAGGWELDDTNGRWEWTGAGTSGDSGGGGSEWDLLHRADLAGVTMLDYPDIFTDDHITYRVELREMYSTNGVNFKGKVYNDGALLSSGYQITMFDPLDSPTGAPRSDMQFQPNAGRIYTADLEITIAHSRPRLLPSSDSQPHIGFYSVLHKPALTASDQKTRDVTVNNCEMATAGGDWNGFQIFTSMEQFDAGTALIYGLRRE